MTETLAYGYWSESTRWELFNEYQHGRVWIVFKNLCICVLCMKVAVALEGLTHATVSNPQGIIPMFRNAHIQKPCDQMNVSSDLLLRVWITVTEPNDGRKKFQQLKSYHDKIEIQFRWYQDGIEIWGPNLETGNVPFSSLIVPMGFSVAEEAKTTLHI